MGQARELMDKATEAIMGGDTAALRELYAADVVATTPDAGTLHGVEELIAYMQGLDEAFAPMRYDIATGYETGEAAIDQGELVATHTGPLQLVDGRTIEPSGKELRLRSIDIARVENGKIVKHDFYFDQMDMLSQLGLLEAAPASAET
jgi:ketosteroid isomerase-like protein